MPLDWLNTPLDADIGDLIARKKRAKTIELLRSQLQGRMVPPVQMRLQLADLLVQAGRENEAVPILIGLADEFAGDGFVAKAIAILKRVDKVQPGRGDVETRLASLVKLQRSAPASSPRGQRVPEFGMEEIREDEALVPPPAASEAEPSPDREPPAAAAAPEPAEPAVVPEPPPIPPAEAPPPPSAETDTTRRVRGVFRRFLASLPGTAAGAEPKTGTPAEPAAPSGQAAPVHATAEPAEDTVPDSEAAFPADATVPDRVVDDAGRDDADTTIVDASAIEPDEPEAEEPEADEPEAAEAETVEAEPTAEAEAEPEAEPEPEPEPMEAVGAAEDGGDDTVPDTPATASAAEADAVPRAPVEAETERKPETDAHGVAGRLRGALKWLVSSLGTAEQGGAAPAQAAASSPAEGAPAEPKEAVTVQEDVGAVQGATAAATSAEARDEEEDEDEEPMSDELFQERLLDLAQDILNRPAAGRAPHQAPLVDRGLVLRYAQRLLATSLFGDLTEEELLAVVRGLRLHLHGPGDVLVTEGERGQSIFVLASGTAKVFVRSPSGRNFPVAELREGEFFGEISSLSGRPRSATVTAAARCELLELDRPTMDDIARSHPRVAEVLEEFYIRRASSPEAAAVRAVPINDAGAERKAIEVLEAHFGQSRWDPRMRLRLADVLLKAGKYQDAVPVLIGLADDLARAGYPEKAIAVLKKIEKIQRRDIEEVNLAPRRGTVAPERRRKARPHPDAAPAAVAAAVKPGWGPQPTAEFFQGWLLDVLRDRVKGSEAGEGDRAEGERSALGGVRGYGPGLMASPLFEDFTDDELLAVIRGLRLLTFDTGDIIITEGEPGQSLFVLTTGTVKVFVRDPEGRNVALCPLGEGAFFGEIATLSGRPRSATVTAASRCELLELDKPALETILKVHPRVRAVLEEHYIARAGDPEAAAIRGTPRDAPAPGGTS